MAIILVLPFAYVGSVIARFDELMKDERLVSQEVDALDRRFDSWSLPGAAVNGMNHAVDRAKSHRPVAALPSSRDVTADLPPEVAAFEVKHGYTASSENYI